MDKERNEERSKVISEEILLKYGFFKAKMESESNIKKELLKQGFSSAAVSRYLESTLGGGQRQEYVKTFGSYELTVIPEYRTMVAWNGDGKGTVYSKVVLDHYGSYKHDWLFTDMSGIFDVFRDFSGHELLPTGEVIERDEKDEVIS